MISPVMPYQKKKIPVNGYEMAVVEEGDGDPIVFLHGNATSSYMWRNIMPHIEGLGRLIAIDNIGQGDSDKLKDTGDHSYQIAEHQRFIDGALEELDVSENVIFVMHDWGGTMGIDWARRHESAVKGLAHCETLVTNHPSYKDYGQIADFLKRLRGPEGHQLVLEDNYFVEKVFTGGVIREMDEEAMTEIRRPYLNPGEDRRATLSWVRQIPIEGEPKNVADLLDLNSDWMAKTDVPKLFIEVEPSQIIFKEDQDVLKTWRNQSTITVRGLHHPQEDSPDDIGQGLRSWIEGLA